jgi:hypothetical protein
MRKRLTQTTAHQLLDFRPDTGQFFWKPRARHWFKNDRSFRSWNTRWAGKEALRCVDTHGYSHGKILNELHLAHRVAWVWVHGTHPEIIDHLNHDRRDNRLCNLQAGTGLSNARNKSLSGNNASGHVGIYENDFSFVVMIQGRYLGSFDTYEQAAAARRAAQVAAGFPDTHGAPRHA